MRRTNDQKPSEGFFPHRLLPCLVSPAFLTCLNHPTHIKTTGFLSSLLFHLGKCGTDGSIVTVTGENQELGVALVDSFLLMNNRGAH